MADINKLHHVSELSNEEKTMLHFAKNAQKNAYAPYSHFHVGCVVMDDSKCFHLGCNVENASYPASICAERTAITTMIAEGGNKIEKVMIISPLKQPCFPCGICLQTIEEFGSNAEIISINGDGQLFKRVCLKDLYPGSFSLEQLVENGELF